MKNTRAVLFGIILYYGLLSLITIPTLRPWIDESWASSPAWMLVNHGYAGTPSMDGSGWGLKDLDHNTYWIPPAFILIQAIWFTIVPYTLEAQRVLTATGGLIGILLGAYVVKRLTGDLTTALIAALLMAGDFNIVSFTSMGRAEGLAFASQMAGFAAYLHWREKDLSRAMLLGQTGVMLSGLIHPNAGVFSVLGIVCLILYLDRSRITLKLLLIAVIPYVIGGICWGAYIMQNFPAFKAQYGMQASSRFMLASKPLEAIRFEIERYMNVFGLGGRGPGVRGPVFLKAVPFLAYFLAIIFVWASPVQRRKTEVRVLSLMIAVYFLYYLLFEGTKSTYYLIYILFLYCSMLAIWIRHLWQAKSLPRVLLVLGVAGVLLIQAGALAAKARLNAYGTHYMPAVNFLREHVQPGQLIIGSQELGFQLGYSDNFVDDFRFGIVSGRKGDYVVIERFYEDRMLMMQKQMPETLAKVKAMLANEYEEVYNQNFYQILRRKKSL